MKDLILQNPRDGVRSARISIYKGNIVLGVEVVRPRMKLETESFNSIQGAKSYYTKEYQSPKWFDRPVWKEE